MASFLRLTTGCILAAAAMLSVRAADDDVVLRAMKDELARTTGTLKLDDAAPPYFASCLVRELQHVEFSASFGALEKREPLHLTERTASVELRVGTPQLDQTYYLTNSANAPAATNFDCGLPLDDNYVELRRSLWLLTDRAYKRSVDWLAKKKAALQNKSRPDETGDFTSEPPTQSVEDRSRLQLDTAGVEPLVRELSAVFHEFPSVANSAVTLTGSDNYIRYVNSEGTVYTRHEPSLVLLAFAAGQAPDGHMVYDTTMRFAFSFAELPTKSQLLAEIRELGTHVTALAAAPLPEAYNGPVLFEGEAAAEAFLQAFIPRLTVMKRPVVGVPRFAVYLPLSENPFQDKVGARVLPDFLNVTDDATQEKFAGVPLFGAGRYDDEGVPTRATKLVEAGRLQTLLTSRVPVPGFIKSTGNRYGGGPCPSTLFITASDGLTPDALKTQLLKLAQQRGRDYGIIVRRITRPVFRALHEPAPAGNSSSGRIEPAILAYKVFADGHEELLRNCEISDLTLSAFKEIVAVGRDQIVYHSLYNVFRIGGLPSSELMSVVVPAMIFDDVTIKAPASETAKPPLSPHPYFAK